MIGNPWGLLALLSLPAILAIHLFRHRFLPHRVAGLFLWASPGRDPTSGRRLHRVESTLSLVLELLLALALGLYLIDVRWGGRAGAEHRVVVLDSSASMSARSGSVDTARRARERVRSLIEESGRQAQVSLVASGPEPSLLAGPAALPGEALSALERWAPALRSHSLAPALDLARALAGPDAAVDVVSDRLPESPPVGARLCWHAVGEPLPNAAILSARRERGSEGGPDRLFLRVGWFGPGPGTAELSLQAGPSPWTRRTLAFGPGGEERLALDVPAGDEPVRVSLSPDGLALDNEAILPRPPLRTVSCAVRFPKGPERDAVEAALAAIPSVRRLAAEDPAKPQLVFAPLDQTVSGLPETWWCRIGTAPGAEPKSFLGPFLVEKAHPLLENVSLGGVIWGGAAAGSGGVYPLVSAGDRILIGLTPEPAGLSLLINVDLRRSTLHRSPDWPILIANLVRLRQEALPGAGAATVRAGESLPVALSPEAPGPVRLIEPSGKTREIPGRGRAVLSRLEEPGLYRVTEGGRPLSAFSVYFQDAAESDLTGAGRGEKVPPPEAASAAASPGEALLDPRGHFLLLSLAVLFFLANAFILRGKPS